MELRSALVFDGPSTAALAPPPDPRDPRRYVLRDKTRDGTFVRIRAVRPDDRAGLIETFTRLSTDSIHARWHGARSAPTAGEIASEIDVDPDVHVGLVATVWIEGSERIVGLGSFFVDPWSEPRRAEVAVTVLDAWQGRGIGSLLFAHLVRIARSCGVDEVYAYVLESNTRMIRVFETAGFPLEVVRDGSQLRIRLDCNPETVPAVSS
jgi:GNAT superfamily N-acetyltransferase